jgi:hypothetical protein
MRNLFKSFPSACSGPEFIEGKQFEARVVARGSRVQGSKVQGSNAPAITETAQSFTIIAI